MNDEFDIEPRLARLWHEADAPLRAPLGFETRLFARLERGVVPTPMLPAMPWWVRAAGERHVVLALLIAGLLAAWPSWWREAAAPARAGVAQLTAGLEHLAAPWLAVLAAPFSVPGASLALALALAPLLAWASHEMARAIERGMARATLGRPA
jgi:hypothetical protein